VRNEGKMMKNEAKKAIFEKFLGEKLINPECRELR
jgi:hypothetical protein